MAQRFDLVVLGGGPGGYVAAIRAAQLGMKTALVEREHLGGICLNWGCIPTKALLRSAELYEQMRRARDFGVVAGDVRADLAAMVARSRRVAARLERGVGHLMKKNGITVVTGHGRLAGAGAVRVTPTDGGETVLEARHVILATGARARELPGLEADGRLVWTYRHALVAESVPESLLVVGSGAIGMEFASFFADLGSRVTVVEVLERVLPAEDGEVSDFVRRAFERRGIRIHTATTVRALARGEDGVEAVLEGPEGERRERFARVLLAVGIVGNVEDIGLETVSVRVEKSHIVTDPFGRTDTEGVWAIGDVAGPPWLAHKASHEGIVCVEAIAGLAPHPPDPRRIPACTYCRPQVASVGLSEAGARAAGHEVRVGRFPLSANGKALALGDTEGFVKTVFDARTGELLGAHMVGPEVTEMVQGFAVAQRLESTEVELMETVFPHPTVSEAMHEAVLDAFGRVIHF